jgi:hypothetical protein
MTQEAQKLTAVEWLINWSKENPVAFQSDYYEAIEEAKAMEKEQMIDFAAEISYGIGVTKEEMIKVAEQYYNETYNK